MLDPILLEVFWNRLTSIVQESAVALMRASFSSVLSEAGDISFGIFDPEGNMILPYPEGGFGMSGKE